MKNINDQIKKLLESKGVKNIKYYMLVNNDGYTFEYKGVKFDLRHWANVYGVETNFYSVGSNSTPENYQEWEHDFMKLITEECNNILRGI